jgi:hypothetical protein
MVETLCGNQTINSEGEGTRLLNFLKKMSYSIGIPKIALHPVDTAVDYYKRENFRTLTPYEEEVLNEEEDVLKTSSDEDSPHETMAINQKARRNWTKIKTAVRVLGIYKKNKKLKDLSNKTIEIKRFYKSKYDEKMGKRGTPIPYPFSTPKTTFVPRGPLVGKVTNVAITDKGTERTITAYPIIPGASLDIARQKSEIKNAEQMSKIREENLKLEAESKAKSKTKKNSKKNASGTRKRKNKRRK